MYQYHYRDHALAVIMESAKNNRQTMYMAAKQHPEFQPDFERADRHYHDLCNKHGWAAEAVFDWDEFTKSQRYQDIVSGRIR